LTLLTDSAKSRQCLILFIGFVPYPPGYHAQPCYY
jgi:hypothetical protein